MISFTWLFNKAPGSKTIVIFQALVKCATAINFFQWNVYFVYCFHVWWWHWQLLILAQFPIETIEELVRFDIFGSMET